MQSQRPLQTPRRGGPMLVTEAKMPTSRWDGLPQSPCMAPSSFGLNSPSLLPIRCVTERQATCCSRGQKLGHTLMWHPSNVHRQMPQPPQILPLPGHTSSSSSPTVSCNPRFPGPDRARQVTAQDTIQGIFSISLGYVSCACFCSYGFFFFYCLIA